MEAIAEEDEYQETPRIGLSTADEELLTQTFDKFSHGKEYFTKHDLLPFFGGWETKDLLFEDMDKDDDGQVTKEDWRAYIQKRCARMTWSGGNTVQVDQYSGLHEELDENGARVWKWEDGTPFQPNEERQRIAEMEDGPVKEQAVRNLRRSEGEAGLMVRTEGERAEYAQKTVQCMLEQILASVNKHEKAVAEIAAAKSVEAEQLGSNSTNQQPGQPKIAKEERMALEQEALAKQESTGAQGELCAVCQKPLQAETGVFSGVILDVDEGRIHEECVLAYGDMHAY